MIRSLLPLLPLALLLSCSGGERCDERSCADGCCGADGVCRTSAQTSCGLAGGACVDCSRTLTPTACVAGTCEPYEQGCLPIDTLCSFDEACCSQVCSKGKCSITACRGNGTICATASECCSDICHQGECIPPRTLGEPCELTAPCQSSLLCRNGICAPPCILQNQACTPGIDECCGAGPCPAQIGFCPEVCRERDAPCIDLACCSGLQCLSGTCSD